MRPGDGRYEIGARTLSILRDQLRPLVERRYEMAFPDTWKTLLGLDRPPGTQLGRGSSRSLDDPDNIVALIVSYEGWPKAFAPMFGRDTDAAQEARGLCFDIRRMRARYALHSKDFTDGDAWRLIDSTRRLLVSRV